MNERKDLPPHLLFQGDILEEKKDGALILQVRRVVYSRDAKPPREPAPPWPQPKTSGDRLAANGGLFFRGVGFSRGKINLTRPYYP